MMATTAALANRSARGARSQLFGLESRRLEESRSRRLGALAKSALASELSRVTAEPSFHPPPAQQRSLSLPHPALSSSSVAVVTGGASGIGLAAAKTFARLGLRVCVADLGEDRLAAAALAVSAVASGSAAHVMTMATDVSRVTR